MTRVELLNTKFIPRLPPKCTVEPMVKFEPVMVTLVPPATGPFAGEIDVTVGAAIESQLFVNLLKICPTLQVRPLTVMVKSCLEQASPT